jgi:DNA-binding LytR/AlgR family response regulator
MQQYRSIIIEDEPLAAEVLSDYISQISFLTLTSICKDAFCALKLLKEEDIDVIFLDIHLPRLKGLDFIRSLRNPPQVIITSAYSEYALQGYEANVVDYLLKPVEFSRFLTAVNKLKVQDQPALLAIPGPERAYVFFNTSKKNVKIFLDEILYIESLREYIRIFTKEKQVLTKYPISKLDELLTKGQFIRVHRSFIVAKDKIETFTSVEIEIKGQRIPIGRTYKELVLSILGKAAE